VVKHVKGTRLSTVYGPLPSWYLGSYLGIDPMMPPRRCYFNCIYCPYDEDEHRGRAINAEVIREDLIRHIKDLNVKFVLIDGIGEPSFNEELADIVEAIERVKAEMGLRLSIALRSCAPHLLLKRLGSALRLVDLVIVKVDAVTDHVVSLINDPPSLDYIRGQVDTLKAIKEHAKLAIKTMLLRTHEAPLNTDPIELRKLLELLVNVSPDLVILDTPLWSDQVSTLDRGLLEEIGGILADHLGWDRVRVRGVHEEVEEVIWNAEGIEDRLINILLRVPLSRKAIRRIGGDIALETFNKLLIRSIVKEIGNGYFVLKN